MIQAHDLTPIQQATTINPDDYLTQNINQLMLGVVLEVYPADRDENYSAMQTEDRHGHLHECNVLITDDGISSYMVLKNVKIPPDAPCGIDDYVERLPRPSTALVTGEEFNDALQNIDPNDLDGDWCVVGFLGGQIERPFVVKWWSHPRNKLDTATSGAGVDGDNLKQDRRYFRRINGVETTITSRGDIIVSTTYANSKMLHGEKPENGRLARSKDTDVGGSLRLYMKPSQTMEFVFDEQVDGVGPLGSRDEESPQLNPPQTTPRPKDSKENTYILWDSESVYFKVPNNFAWESEGDTDVIVGTDFNVEVGGNTSILTDGVLTLEGSQILLGSNAKDTEAALKGMSFKDWLLNFTVDSPFGPLKATQAYIETLPASPAFSKKTIIE